MAFKGRVLVRTKIVIDNKIIEQVNSLNSLGSLISYEKEVNIDDKLNYYLKITGIINHTFRPQKTGSLK
jgi:hypothetical protein